MDYMSQNQKEYLGDSVYAQFDGYGITLTTENGLPTDPSNAIFLEPAVLVALERFVKILERKDG
jgi:hypothetical protein